MKNASHAQLESIVRLRALHDFRVFLEWVAECQAEANKALRLLTGEELNQMQGEARALDAILNKPDEAAKAIAKRAAPKRPVVFGPGNLN